MPENSNKAFVCNFNGCEQLIKEPVMLPCTQFVCGSHFKELTAGDRFQCTLCGDSHQVPDGGFKKHTQFDKCVQAVIKDDVERKEAFNLLKNFKELTKELDQLKISPKNISQIT
jgi:hypothetical protein